MFGSLASTAIGKWFLKQIPFVLIVGVLLLLLGVMYAYYSNKVSSLEKQNNEQIEKIGKLTEKVDQLTAKVDQLNKEMALKKESDKIADDTSYAEAERTKVIQANADKAVDRIRKALKPISIANGLPSVNNDAPAAEQVVTYEDPSPVVIVEIWKTYCADPRINNVNCQKLNDIKENGDVADQKPS